ncbi:sugar-transfer associated ATP-grasp domain-containing protein [Alkalicoccus daliensis]|uniref:Sugar-transfer associated ATP-grasp n=1 Tax=Alkalicoccus daliensis TaxID=745820 RepID=A0A1H0GC05_9BACI|nr:sugar-transfer associated ATP-grasp domain-containing protein [Alkalicoccus daliensis]SDO04412.1 Sugar-transfer associated ATP-grasp [Alkalicoccus daliensis]
MKAIIKRLRPSYKNSAKDQANLRHKKQALEALNHIENNSNYVLSKKQKSEIDEYSKATFGSAAYAYWLYVYTAYNEEFIEGWIPDNFFGYVVAPKVNKGIGKIANVKTLSKKIIGSELLPDKFYWIDNALYTAEYDLIRDKDIQKKLFETDEELYIKRDLTNKGKGVIKVNKQSFNLSEMKQMGDCVVQTPIKQAAWFNEFITGSVATIRITTVKGLDHSIRMRAATLRLGRKDSQFVESSDAVSVPIVNQNGDLGEFGIDHQWKKHYEHPDSKVKFAGASVPHFSRAVKECENIHRKLPQFTIVGWDLAITEHGDVKIIEWNAAYPGIKYHEALVGPCFTDMKWEKLR